MNNRYLRDRASRRMGMRRMDGRNPYGSRGGYVVSRSRRDRAMGDMRGNDRGMDYRHDMPEYDSRYDYRNSTDYRGGDYHMGYEQHREYSRPMQYELYGVGGMRPRMDYGYDYGYDYRGGRDYGDMEKEYEEELKKWIKKLQKKDRFGWSKEQVVQQAKSMGVRFEEYDEEEFFATYLMMISDFPQIANEPHTYLAMAKAFLEDDDAELKGSEKLCAYMYTIVLGKEE